MMCILSFISGCFVGAVAIVILAAITVGGEKGEFDD